MQHPQYGQYAPVAGQPQVFPQQLPTQVLPVQVPTPVVPQQVITQQPTVNNNVVVQAGGAKGQVKRDWASGLFDCCSDCGTCWAVACCPVCVLVMMSSSMDEGCLMPFLVPAPLVPLRTKLRAQQRIKGSILKDCAASHFCWMCTLCQLKREYAVVQKAKATYNVNVNP